MRFMVTHPGKEHQRPAAADAKGAMPQSELQGSAATRRVMLKHEAEGRAAAPQAEVLRARPLICACEYEKTAAQHRIGEAGLPYEVLLREEPFQDAGADSESAPHNQIRARTSPRGGGMVRRLGDESCNLGATRTAEKARKHSSMPAPVWHDLRAPAVV